MKKFITLTLAIITFLTASAWGQKGHDVTAFIAEQHLTTTARLKVAELLKGRSMVYWANWLDNASHTPDYEYTKTWHYKNIDADQTYEDCTLNPKGDVVSALKTQIEVLADSTAKDEQKSLALKIVIHLMGDLHQPMHLGHLSDKGGNSVKLDYFRRENNLHSIWDTQLVESAHKWSYSEWQYNLDRITPETESRIMQGDIDEWAKQTYLLATNIYNYFKPGIRISYDDVARWSPVIERQFLLGGVRLAAVLNEVFK
ncbi:MAG: S1/P1 nuclease [Muribaculaceae bacterium]